MTKSTTVKSYREEPVPKLCRIQFQLIQGWWYMAKWIVVEVKLTDKTARSKYIHWGSWTIVTKKTQNFYYNQWNYNSFYPDPETAMRIFIETAERTKSDPDRSPNWLACLDSAIKQLQESLPKIKKYFLSHTTES